MDPNLLNFFAVPNNQTLNHVDQNNDTSQQQHEPSPWKPTGLEGDMGASGNQGGPSYDYQSNAASDMSFNQAPMPSPYTSSNKTILPTRGPPRGHQQRKRDAHERKRTKVDTDSALESLDYWIRFDDEENERTGSYEIDFSKRFDPMTNNTNTHYRPGYGGTSTTPGLGTGVYATAPPFQGAEYFDDNALDNALSDDEEEGLDSMSLEEHLSKIETMPPPEVPPREGLYSTPLSWEKPEPGLRMEPDFGLGNTAAAMNAGFGQTMSGMGNNQVLSNDEQRRLLAIAMNTGRTPASFMPPSGFGLGFGAGLGTGLPPDFNSSIDSLLGTPTGDRSQKQTPTPANSSKAPSRNQDVKTEASSETGLSSARPGLSRTNTATSDIKGKDKLKPGDRTAHNDIERKYRTNLKDKIAELRDAVPALHSIPEDGTEEGENSQRAPKVSKGTVLTKATEYIQYLERRNRSIMKEHQELARRLQAFEQLLSASARQPFLMPNHSRTLFDPRGFC
ncbi:myc-type bHLH transcription factor [Fusarium napiforme]|uniref:Myc-type bHLH transcription factor n=1 Tax=Fusarium napiforme TaxID=42672 RepID=A0A8H5NC88_9HYPO|nr:myc-type bHLH transcription factor [Fusarium napiforme]